MAQEVRCYSGMAELAQAYDGFVLDLWGVIHDGIELYPGVVDCLHHLAEEKKSFVMLSNAPRRAAAIARSMVGMGMPEEYCRDIVSSGEATYLCLAERTDPWFQALGRKFLHLGPERDENLFEGIGLEKVTLVEDAEFIINTGPWRDEEQVSDYEARLVAGAARGLGMVCANPDLEVIRGGNRIICAGALARRYEELGGTVRYLGKPRTDIYAGCFARLGVADHGRILAVGDSLRTDIAGATASGIDSVLVAGGLHREEFGIGGDGGLDAVKITAACAREGHVPDAAIAAFIW